MGFHHLALATRDMAAIDDFYTNVMGFDLVKTVLGPTPDGGWAKHFFYDAGQGQLMAFWELHVDAFPAEFPTGLSEGAGLPFWVNHVAFWAEDVEEIQVHKQRWLEHGCRVAEIDHDWCYSIYTLDPNGTWVEFCATTAPFTDEDRAFARAALVRDDLPHSPRPSFMKDHKPTAARTAH